MQLDIEIGICGRPRWIWSAPFLGSVGFAVTLDYERSADTAEAMVYIASIYAKPYQMTFKTSKGNDNTSGKRVSTECQKHSVFGFLSLLWEKLGFGDPSYKSSADRKTIYL